MGNSIVGKDKAENHAHTVNKKQKVVFMLDKLRLYFAALRHAHTFQSIMPHMVHDTILGVNY